MIDEKQAVAMIEPRSLDTMLHPQFDGKVLKTAPVIGSALAAYSADQTDANWEKVVDAFVTGWAIEYNAQG